MRPGSSTSGSGSGPNFIPGQRAAVSAPLFHAAWLFALGIVLSRAVWLRPGVLLCGLLALAVLCALAAFHALRLRWLPLAALWILAGAWCAEMQPAPAPAPVLLHASDGLLRTVEGTVVDAGMVRKETDEIEPEKEMLAQRIDLRLSSLEIVNDTEDAQLPADGGVRLTVRWPVADEAAPQLFHCGERVRALVRLYPPEVYHDAGAWSRADYLLKQGITSTASVGIERVHRLGVAPGHFFKCRLSEWQHESAEKLLALPGAMKNFPPAMRLSGNDAILLTAMITGDRTLLSHSLRVGFERTGSFHMLVVSGLHLAIVSGFVLWLLRKLRVPRIPATLLTIAASCGYALFTGFATPVQRSLWMVSIYLIGRLIFRQRSVMNTIGFAALILLCVSPGSLFDASFQMTLLAVVVIGGIAAPMLRSTIEPYLAMAKDLKTVAIDNKVEPRLAQYRVILRMIAKGLQKAVSRWVGWTAFPWCMRAALRVVEMLAVTAVVELAMTLPMAVYFHRITLFALPVNLLILPLLLVMMPAALLTWAALLAGPGAAAIPGAAAALALHFGVWLVELFGSMKMGDLRIATPTLMQIAAFCVLLAVAMILAVRGRWARRGAWAVLLCAAVVAVFPRAAEHPRNALLVEAIDVGQGDSILLITPEGKTMLVDAGGFGGGAARMNQYFDIGEEVVSEALWARGIRHLDVVALSHAHSDHMGGMPAVLRNFHPEELWVGNNPHVPDYDALLAEAAALGVRVRQFHAGDAMQFGSTQVRVLAPMADYQPGATPSNDDSMVLRMAYGATSVLLEGDAEAPTEGEMLGEPDIESTLLKVGHHGSLTSTRPAFLARVAPKWAVISCGLRNTYGFPREEILDELENADVKTLSTDIHGASCFALDGKHVTARSECGYGELP